MKNIINVLLILFTFSVSFAQIDHELRFDCLDHDLTKCNPFTISSPFCPDNGIYKNNWRVSHGSPQIRTFSGNNASRVAVLKAKDTDGFSPKGEGMFLSYNFLANHNYTIEYVLRIESSDFFTTIAATSKAANGLTAKTNGAVCAEETLPSVSDTQTIMDEAPLPFETGNSLGLISITDFIPTKNFSYFWLYAEPLGFGTPTAEFIVSHITITDVTPQSSLITNNNICCNQNFTTSSADPALLTGSVPSGGTGSYSYQWQRRTTGSWSNISGARSQNYDPPTVSQNTSYKRIVTSGTQTSESNTVRATVNTNSGSHYSDICCDQEFQWKGTPTELVGNPLPAGAESFEFWWYRTKDRRCLDPSQTCWTGELISGAKDETYVFTEPIYETYYYIRRVNTRWPGGSSANHRKSVRLKVIGRLLETENYASNFTLNTCEDVKVEGNLTSSNGATVQVSSRNSIAVVPNSNINGSFTLKIEDCGTSSGGRMASNVVDPTLTVSRYTLAEQLVTASLDGQISLVKVYPNPSQGRLKLLFSNKISTLNSTINIYNSIGGKVYSENMNESTSQLNLDLSFLRPGNYHLQFLNGLQTVTKQIIID